MLDLTKVKNNGCNIGYYQYWKFKVLGEHTNLNKSWEQYLKRFDYYIKAANISRDEQKCALLLHISGYKYKISSKHLKIREQHMNMLLTSCQSVSNPPKIFHMKDLFHKSKQNTDEAIDKYIVLKSKLALECEFTDKNEMIRAQVVNLCHSSKFRKK